MKRHLFALAAVVGAFIGVVMATVAAMGIVHLIGPVATLIIEATLLGGYLYTLALRRFDDRA